MAQDSQGFLWIGTQTGLYRYDGARATKMTEVENLIGHYVLDMLIAPDGTPWFAGNRGIAYYKNGEFHQLPIPATAMPLSSGNQLFAVDSQGIVYVLLFSRGLLRIDLHNPAQARMLGEAEGIWETSGGIVRDIYDTIWFTFHGRLAHLTPGSTTIELDPEIHLPKDRVVALLFDGAQTLWLRTATKLAQVDRHQHKLKFEAAPIGIANEEEGKPSLDRDGKLLVPSSAGLYWQENDHWRVITDQQGISSNDIQFALEDREGTVWIAGSGTGLDRLPGVREWSAWTTLEGLPDNTTWATLRDRQGRLWVSTGSGIGIWEATAHRWQKLTSLDGHSPRNIRQMQLAGDGSVWAHTVTGAILRINPTNFATTTFANYRGRSFVSIQAAPDGSIWATTRSRLIRFVPDDASAKPIDVPLPPKQDVEYLSFSPHGVLWATGPGTLSRFDGRNWKILTAQDGLRGQTITSHLAVGDDEVWVAYNDVVGVTRVQLDANGVPHCDHRNWDWTVIARDSQQRIWFNGTDGLAILSPDGHLQHISHASGLIWDDISPWTGVREEQDGSFLIATSRGLARYKPSLAVAVQAASRPNVMFTSVSLGGIERRTRDVPEVSPADGTLTVQFTPLVLDTAERISCRYQLNGLDELPTDTLEREVRYGGLPAGKYEFRVQCRQLETNIASAPATFRFRVLPTFWQTWPARGIVGLSFLLFFWAFVSFRTRTLNQRKRELEQAVAQRSAELLQKNKELEEISLTDPLTTTRNRRYFYETISTDIAQALRSHLRTIAPQMDSQPRQELIFVLVDIDRFKRVNDELGHASGDRLLQEVAKRIASVMRRSDDLVRWGGEEFLLVCRTTDREHAPLLCQRVLEVVRELPFDVGNGVQIHKTCSIGWAPFPWLKHDVGMLSIDNVIELADKALYLAKREGRNRSFGMLPAPEASRSPRAMSIENLRDCPPDLVHFV
jgi:diguanylate cyclase (GGDEF)-like protein